MVGALGQETQGSLTSLAYQEIEQLSHASFCCKHVPLSCDLFIFLLIILEYRTVFPTQGKSAVLSRISTGFGDSNYPLKGLPPNYLALIIPFCIINSLLDLLGR